MNRRDIVKYFGVGSIIAPLSSTGLQIDNAVQLIKVPEVRSVELFSKVPEPVDLSNYDRGDLILYSKDGKTTRYLTLGSLVGSGVVPVSSNEVVIRFVEWNYQASPAFLHNTGKIDGRFTLKS